MIYTRFKTRLSDNYATSALVIGTREVSFGELSLRVEKMTATLRQLGIIDRGDIVDINMSAIDDALVCILSLTSLGAVPRPVFDSVPHKASSHILLAAQVDLDQHRSFLSVVDGIEIIETQSARVLTGEVPLLYIPSGKYVRIDRCGISVERYDQYLDWFRNEINVTNESVLFTDNLSVDNVLRSVMPFLLFGRGAVCSGERLTALPGYVTHYLYTPGSLRFAELLSHEAVGSPTLEYVFSFWDSSDRLNAEQLHAIVKKSPCFKGYLEILGKGKEDFAWASRKIYRGEISEARSRWMPVDKSLLRVIDTDGVELPPGIVGDVCFGETAANQHGKPERGRYDDEGYLLITEDCQEEAIYDGFSINLMALEAIIRSKGSLNSKVLRITDDQENSSIAVLLCTDDSVVIKNEITRALTICLDESLLQRLVWIPIYHEHWNEIERGSYPKIRLLSGELVKRLSLIGLSDDCPTPVTLSSFPGLGGAVLESAEVDVKKTPSVDIHETPVLTASLPSIAVGPILDGPHRFKTLCEVLSASDTSINGMTFIDGKREWFVSYRELHANALRKLGGFQKCGLQRGDVVILQIRRVHDFVPLFWGCLLGGIIPLVMPLPQEYVDGSSSLEKLASVFQFLNARAILTDIDAAESLGRLESGKGLAAAVLVNDDHLDVSHGGAPHPVSPNDIAFVLLTSGSTGMPKCVPLSHKNVLEHIYSITQLNAYSSDDCVVSILPIEHITPLVTLHIRSVALDNAQVQIANNTFIGKPMIWFETLQRFKNAYTFSPNFAYRMVADAATSAADGTYKLDNVKKFMCAGEMISREIVARFVSQIERFGGRQDQFQPIYGMTELSGAVTFVESFDLAGDFFGIDEGKFNYRTKEAPFCNVGKPMTGVSLRVVDEQGGIVRQGIVGRVQVKGKVVIDGYLFNDSANLAAFAEGDWFNTGDLGVIVDGALVVTGREKDIAIRNGMHYFCHEFEEVVKSVDGVNENFVAACVKRNAKEGTEDVFIFYSPEGPMEQRKTLERKIKTSITDRFGFQPDRLVSVLPEAFTQTDSGKLSRMKLLSKYIGGELHGLELHIPPITKNEVYQQRIDVLSFEQVDELKDRLEAVITRYPEQKHCVQLRQLTGDRDAMLAAPKLLLDSGIPVSILNLDTVNSANEAQLLLIWRDVLKRQDLTVFDSFFSFGGDSIKAIQIVNRMIEAQFSITINDLFLYPTIESLSRYMEDFRNGPSLAADGVLAEQQESPQIGKKSEDRFTMKGLSVEELHGLIDDLEI